MVMMHEDVEFKESTCHSYLSLSVVFRYAVSHIMSCLCVKTRIHEGNCSDMLCTTLL